MFIKILEQDYSEELEEILNKEFGKFKIASENDELVYNPELDELINKQIMDKWCK